MSGKSGKSAIFALAAVWFGAHVGGGFATGNQTMQYFARFGWSAVIMPLISMAIVGLTAREILIMAMNHKTYNYRAWALIAYQPYEKIMAVVLEVATLMLFLLATSGAIAGCASLIESFGLPYVAGVFITGIALLFLSIFGAKLVGSASSMMTVVMVAALLAICVAGLQVKTNELYKVFETKAQEGSTWDIIWNMLKYSGFQAYAAITMIPFASMMFSIRDINKSMGIGYILNAVMTALSCALLLAWIPMVRHETLPIFVICEQLSNTFLLIAYSLMLVLAFISTALGAVFGSVTRFESLIKVPASLVTRRALLAIIFMGTAMAISMFGLTKIVMVGYGYTGIIAIFIIIIPMLTVGRIKNKRFIAKN